MVEILIMKNHEKLPYEAFKELTDVQTIVCMMDVNLIKCDYICMV